VDIESQQLPRREDEMSKWVCAALVFGVLATAGVADTPPDVTVLPAEVRGIVLFPDGETPVDGLKVRVWNAETERIVFRTRTNTDGVFDIPHLDEGRHYVTVGPVRIDMRVLTARGGVTPQPHGVVVVVPKRISMMPILVPGAAAAVAIPQTMSP
jgi:hypothetical protein